MVRTAYILKDSFGDYSKEPVSHRCLSRITWLQDLLSTGLLLFLGGRVISGWGASPRSLGTALAPQNGHILYHSLFPIPWTCPSVQTLQPHQDSDYKTGDLGCISAFPASLSGDPWQISLNLCPQRRITARMRKYKLQGILKITEARSIPNHLKRKS